MRFEPPAESRRWEKPTFEVEEGDELPFEEITKHVTTTFSNHVSMATSHVRRRREKGKERKAAKVKSKERRRREEGGKEEGRREEGGKEGGGRKPSRKKKWPCLII
jgi:tRNA uridine 5-carbamoylmethylation protein Kti12